MNLDELIKMLERHHQALQVNHLVYPALKRLKDLRNRVHLQKVEDRLDHDYNAFNFSVKKEMGAILYEILSSPMITKLPHNFEFLKKNTDVTHEKKSFFLPEDVEIDEDARDEYKDTDADSFAPVSNGELYQKPTAKERKAQQEREMAQLARGFGTQVMSTHEIHRAPAEKKADTLDDVLFAAKKSSRPSPIPSKPQMSATEKYGLDKDDEELSFVRKASTPVSDTKYDDEAKKAATPVKVKVKPKVVPVKSKVTEKSIEIEKPNQPNQVFPLTFPLLYIALYPNDINSIFVFFVTIVYIFISVSYTSSKT